MDAKAIAAGLADFETPGRSFPFGAAADLTVVRADGSEVPLPSLWASPSPSTSPSAVRKTILVFGRNML